MVDEDLLRERVKAGIEWLNSTEAIPDNWADLIDLNTLVMNSAYQCVLGQLASHLTLDPVTDDPNYFDVIAVLGLHDSWATRYGFCLTGLVPLKVPMNCFPAVHEALERIWGEEITAIRAGKSS